MDRLTGKPADKYKIMVVDDEPDILNLLEKAQLRRAQYRLHPSEHYPVKIGELMIDPEGCRVLKGSAPIELTAREFEILCHLAENKGRVISRERLYETIWGEDSLGCDNTMMVHIRHLREMLVKYEFLKIIRKDLHSLS